MIRLIGSQISFYFKLVNIFATCLQELSRLVTVQDQICCDTFFAGLN